MDRAGLDRAVDLVRARGASAQLCVLRDGQPILDEAVRRIGQARPKFPPGAVPACHELSYGFILGEIVRRVSGAADRASWPVSS